MGSLLDSASLLVATLDLSLVQLLRQAMRTADISAAASAGTGHTVVASSPVAAATKTVQSKGLRYADRPAATFEKSHVLHWHPRLHELQPDACSKAVQPVEAKPSIEPPWRCLPWPERHRPIAPPGNRFVKVDCQSTDVTAVGRTLDLFV